MNSTLKFTVSISKSVVLNSKFTKMYRLKKAKFAHKGFLKILKQCLHLQWCCVVY